MSPESSRSRLRLRLPTGAELEAEGDHAFIQQERAVFLASLKHASEAAPGAPSETEKGWPAPAWESLADRKGPVLQLRSKLPRERTDKDACLVLLAAAQKLLHLSKPTAAQLARWLRASGYPIQRVDRALAQAIQTGEILASGSRRARRYELTGPGRAKAYLLARELEDLVAGAPDDR